jgi:hypothetical protein
VVEDGVLALPIEEIQGRYAVSGKARGLFEHADNPIGIRVGEWFQKSRIDEAEDRRVGADADGQGD